MTSFEIMQQASDSGGGALVYFAFDLLELDGVDVAAMPLLERKERLAAILKNPPAGIAFSEHEGGDGEAFRKAACRHGLEGIISKKTDRRYLPGYRGVWVKSKCLIAPSSSSSDGPTLKGRAMGLGALLLGYYRSRRPTALRRPRSGLACPSECSRCCMSGWEAAGDPGRCPLAVVRAASQDPLRRPAGTLSKVHWVRPELVAEITYLSWSEDGLLRHTVFVGLREDKLPNEVRREQPGL